MTKWNTKYHGIGLAFEPGVVRIRNDEILRIFLTTQKNPCRRLARVAKKAYRLKYGVDLVVSTESLAMEIWGHYRIKRTCMMLEGGRFPLFTHPLFKRSLDWMMRHMATIDIGERRNDNNRWLWDLLAGIPLVLCK